MQRRRLLQLGLLGAATLAVAGGGFALMSPGFDKGRLSPGARELFTAVGRAVLDGSLPTEPVAQRAALDGLLQRLEATIAGLSDHARAELSQLLALLASTPGRVAFAGLSTAWSEASVPQVQDALQSMRLSRIALRQQAYHALHDLTGGAYFSAPGTWPALGYPGPVSI